MRYFLALAFILSIAKFSSGQILNWVAQMDRVRPSSVYTDGNGNVYTTGNFLGPADFDPGPGELILTGQSDQIYVQKLDTSGNLVWVKHMAGGLGCEGFSVAADNVGNVYVVGYFRGTVDFDPGAGTMNLSNTPSFYDLFILKLDANGNLVWVKQLKNIYESTPAASLAVDGNGNVYCTGFFKGVVDFDPGSSDHSLFSGNDFAGYVLKLNTSGNFDWVNIFSSLSHGNAIATDGDYVYTTGWFMGLVGIAPPAVNLTSKGMVDTFLMKLTAAGEYVWAKQIGGPGSDYGRSISLDNNGNIFLAGEFEQTCDFNIDGAPATLTSSGMKDIFVQKFGPSGSLLWVKQIGGEAGDVIRNISVSSTGDLFVAGQITGTANFGIGATPKTFSSSAGSVFLVNVTPLEEIGWIIQYPVFQLSIAAKGDHIYASGRFFNTMDFDPDEGVKSLTASSIGSAFVLKYENEIEEVITGVEESGQTSFSVYPNPVKFVAFIDLGETRSGEFTLRVKDVHNRIVTEQIIQNVGENQIDMTGLSDGLYIIELMQSGNRINSAKVIKN